MRILIFGFGRSGKGAAKLALSKGESVYIFDDDPKALMCGEMELLKNLGVTVYDIRVHKKPDLIIISPNIPLNNPLLLRLKDIPVISEMQYAMRFCKGKVVALSGTNGKTTTCTLLHSILSRRHKSYLLGNIGTPLSERVEEISENDFVVLEVSSFQLETSSYFRPNIAGLINIAPDHLDRHSLIEEYAGIKRRLFSDMGKGDYAILNAEERLLFDEDGNIHSACTRHIKGLTTYFISTERAVEGCYLYDKRIFCNIDGYTVEIISTDELKIMGTHNCINTMFATLSALLCGMSVNEIAAGLREFNGLSHRTEYVDEVCGVKFFNDSKATNPHAVTCAVKQFHAPLVIIMGGSEKNLDFEELIASLKQNTFCVFIGETKDRLRAAANKVCYNRYDIANSLRDAVHAAFKIAKDIEGTVLLSPACASFDMFDNYEHRGECFKTYVKELKKDIECE